MMTSVAVIGASMISDREIWIEQLANTYEVLKEKKNVRMLIMELEGLETRYSSDPNYYRIMEGLYGRNKMIDKMKEAAAKGEKLR